MISNIPTVALCGLGGYGAGLDGSFGGLSQGGYSSYESASTAGYGAGASDAFLAGSGGASNEYYSSSTYGGVGGGVQGSSSGYGASFEQQGLAGAASAGGAGYNFNSSEQQASSATVYATDAQGLFKDPNPQVIRRPAAQGVQTLMQRVVVRFLQPPPVPPPGVSFPTNTRLSHDVNTLFFNYYSSLSLSKKFVHLNHLHHLPSIFVSNTSFSQVCHMSLRPSRTTTTTSTHIATSCYSGGTT